MANSQNTIKLVTKASLPDLIGSNGPRPLLYCRRCGMECSANRGDYFNLPETYTFRCCKRPMRLVFKQTVYVAA